MRWLRAAARCEPAGEAPAGLWAALVALIERDGYRLDRHEPTDDDDALAWVSQKGRVIWVPPGISEREALRRGLHEYAHLRLGHYGRSVPHNQEETEADSVAFVVGRILGLDFHETTFGCLTAWLSNGSEDHRTEAARAVLDTAHAIVADLGLYGKDEL